MIKKVPRLWRALVMAILALWGLADGPDLVTSKMVINNQQSFRDAKAKQDADRRAVELQRQQILANTAAKFEERELQITPATRRSFSRLSSSSIRMKRSTPLWIMLVMAILALWGLVDGPSFVTSKLTTSSQQSLRDAKAQQDADRRAAELQRLQILTSTAAKFEERQRTNSNYDSNTSWNRRYRSSASTRQQ
ncbi:unnamed protein product [Phytophthora lilii]|uniref:Unnamed protein product n=1 Tax=Phytophthora lilii TaxID=2077276 RepID=A0A9W6TWH6_9STRA|nr:unnamed protein product [Phytophthora lilii]